MLNSHNKTKLRCYKNVLETVVARMSVSQVFQAFVDFNWSYKYLWLQVSSTSKDAWCVTKFKDVYEKHGTLPEEIGPMSFKGGPPTARQFYTGCLKDYLLDLLFTSICENGPRKACLFLSKYNDPALLTSTPKESKHAVCAQSCLQ